MSTSPEPKYPPYPYSLILRDNRFWIAQGFVLIIPTIHRILESKGILTGLGMLYFIPLSLLWWPMIFTSYKYGYRGFAATGTWVACVCIPHWILAGHQGISRAGEITLVLLGIMTAFSVGRLQDQKIAAERKAKEYADHSVLSREETLRKLSIEIHDGAMQDLIAACQILKPASRGASPHSGLTDARNAIEGAVHQLRNISRTLHPSILDDLGIVPAVRQHLTDFGTRTGISHTLKVRGEECRFNSETELQIFRITQEALRNVERHSGAQNVAVRIFFTSRGIRLVIADDGVGFDPSRRKDGHFGLVSMRERADVVHGKLRINSQIGRGTKILASFPVAT